MQIIYPSDDFNSKVIDDTYLAESEMAKKLGYDIGILDLNKFKENGQGFYNVDKGKNSIWRGWMLNENDYRQLYSTVKLLVSPENYLYAHHINKWYFDISKYTISSIFVSENEDFKKLNEKSYFVKDYVKSNTGKLGSIAKNIDNIKPIIEEIKKYRGEIEGGLCLRDVVDIIPKSEKRYFVVAGKLYSNLDERYPDFLDDVVLKLPKNLFYSIDVAKVNDYTNKEIVIEIGDGQVSDIKEWDLNSFINVLKGFSQLESVLKNKEYNKLKI